LSSAAASAQVAVASAAVVPAGDFPTVFPPSREALARAFKAIRELEVRTAKNTKDKNRADYAWRGVLASDPAQRRLYKIDFDPLETWHLLQFHAGKSRGDWAKCVEDGVGFFHPNRTPAGLSEHWKQHFPASGPNTTASFKPVFEGTLARIRSEAEASVKLLFLKAEKAEELNRLAALGRPDLAAEADLVAMPCAAARSSKPSHRSAAAERSLSASTDFESADAGAFPADVAEAEEVLARSSSWDWTTGSMSRSSGWTDDTARKAAFAMVHNLFRQSKWVAETAMQAIDAGTFSFPRGVTAANMRWVSQVLLKKHFQRIHKRYYGFEYGAGAASSAAWSPAPVSGSVRKRADGDASAAAGSSSSQRRRVELGWAAAAAASAVEAEDEAEVVAEDEDDEIEDFP